MWYCKSNLKNRIIALVSAAAIVSGAAGMSFGVTAYADSVPSKDETVYAMMTADSEITEILADELIHVGDQTGKVEDLSYLSNIENVSGSEKFKRDGTSLTWKAEGKDIRYQGRSERGLPVNLTVTYYLNGKQVNASEIAGKSGDVEIHFDYDISSTVSVDDGVMTHPYVMVSGLSLSNEHFRDISVNYG
jgi:putative membrane protein